MKQPVRSLFAVVMFCFLVSGMAGLVYQVAWARYLSLFLGHTSYAVVAVLVAFMGGLALGNAWFGARADRSSKPLALYGWLEIAIAVYAVIFPFYYKLCHFAFISLTRYFETGSAVVLVLKFVFSLATILLPTVMMGATFPVLTRFFTRSLSELREKVGILYAINSTGAVLGCIVADFWWLPAMGLEFTVFAGAILNFVAGAIALHFSKQINEGNNPAASILSSPEPKETDERYTPAELKMAVVAIGLSGFVAMLYEIVWTRLLGLALGSSTHAFSLMLITFITGIAVGAWIISRWKASVNTLDAFAYAELALAGTLLISMFFYAALPYWFLKVTDLLSRRPETYPVYELVQASMCFIVMFIPATCLGMTLPLTSRVATAEIGTIGRSVGRVFAVNTIGTVLGTIITGLWLMPKLGLARTFAVGVAINAMIGFAVLWRRRFRSNHVVIAAVASAVFVWAVGAVFHEQWMRIFSLGLWRGARAPVSWEAFENIANQSEIAFYRDGAGSSVMVQRTKSGNTEHLSLKVNGKADASTGSDVTTQRLTGHLPVLLRQGSEHVLIVGMGSGMTAASAALHPGIKRVDMVEISPEVIEAASYFAKYNNNVLQNPLVRVIREDAKSFLQATDQIYDAIVSEPSNPWMAGVSGVFSREYYENCFARLKQDGLMVQWVQIYETDDITLDIVLRTFGSVFPYFSIWQTSPGDLILVGGSQPYKPDLEALEKRFHEPAIKTDMESVNIVTLSALLTREIVSQQNGLFIPLSEGPIHSDYFPVLEYRAQEAFFVQGIAGRWRRSNEQLLTRPSTLLGEYLKKHELTEADYKAIGRFYLEYRMPDPEIFRTLLLRWQKEKPESTLPMELMAQASERALTAELEAWRLRPLADHLMKIAEKDPEPLRQYESYLIQMYRSHRSVFYLPPTDHLEAVIKRLLETNSVNQRVYKLHLAELAWDRGDDKACMELGRQAMDIDLTKAGPATFSIDPKAPRYVLFRMIEVLWRTGQLAEAFSLSQDVKRQGFAYNEPLLDMMIRKVEGYVMQTGVIR